MKQTILDSFGTPDSIEWRHHRCSIRQNGHPCGTDDRYLVWDRHDALIGSAPSLQAAKALVEAEQV